MNLNFKTTLSLSPWMYEHTLLLSNLLFYYKWGLKRHIHIVKNWQTKLWLNIFATHCYVKHHLLIFYIKESRKYKLACKNEKQPHNLWIILHLYTSFDQYIFVGQLREWLQENTSILLTFELYSGHIPEIINYNCLNSG